MIKKISEESEDESEDENELAAYRKKKLIQGKECSHDNKEPVNEEVNIKVDNNVQKAAIRAQSTEVLQEDLKDSVQKKKIDTRQVVIKNVPDELNNISLIDKYFSK